MAHEFSSKFHPERTYTTLRKTQKPSGAQWIQGRRGQRSGGINNKLVEMCPFSSVSKGMGTNAVQTPASQCSPGSEKTLRRCAGCRGCCRAGTLSMARESGVSTNFGENHLSMSIEKPQGVHLLPSITFFGEVSLGNSRKKTFPCELRSCVFSKITVQGSRKGVRTTVIST